jgi:secondary thiamine-phosphate synthase enzyme
MNHIEVKTERRTQFLDITRRVREIVDGEGMRDGSVLVYVPHTTAGVTINECADPDVMMDMESALDRIVPWAAGYEHGEGNSAAHIKTALVGTSVTVPVADGVLQLGTWQGIFFCEFDGPRTRQVWIQAQFRAP